MIIWILLPSGMKLLRKSAEQFLKVILNISTILIAIMITLIIMIGKQYCTTAMLCLIRKTIMQTLLRKNQKFNFRNEKTKGIKSNWSSKKDSLSTKLTYFN